MAMTIVSPTTELDRMYAAALAENEKFEAEKRAVKEYQKRNQERVAAQNKRLAEILKKIAAYIPDGHDVVIDEESAKLFVDKINVSGFIYLKERISRSYDIVVGAGNNTLRFPQRKDGTYNYEKIVPILLRLVANKNAANKMEMVRQYNLASVEALRKDLGLGAYTMYTIQASSNAEKPVSVDIKIKQLMTHTETIKLFKVLESVGIKFDH